MYSKAKILGHPIHPMLVGFPVAFYTGTLVAFIVYASSHDPFWLRLANIANWAGVVTGAVAAVPGLIDWATGIPRGSAASRTGLIHMALNAGSLTTFLVNAIVYSGRWNDVSLAIQHSGRWSEALPAADTGIVLSAIGVLLMLAAGFFGWSLVQDHHVGVHLSPEQERLEPAPLQPGDGHGPPRPSYASK